MPAAGRTTRLGRDARAMAAVEFAFALPILLVLLSGMYDCVQIVRLDIKLSHSTEMLAKMVAQQPFGFFKSVAGNQQESTADGLVKLCAAQSLEFLPFSPKMFGAYISEYSDGPRQIGGGDAATFDWQDAGKSCPRAMVNDADYGPIANISKQLTTRVGDIWIIVQGYYVYTPVFSTILGKNVTLSAISYAKPRSNRNLRYDPN